jgi:AraC-like DNA-binding protein
MTRRCPAGLEHGALRVPLPGGPAGWIEFGQVFLASPRRDEFESLQGRFPEWQQSGYLAHLEDAFFSTPVITRERLQAGVELLRLVVHKMQTLLPDGGAAALPDDPVEKAREYIRQNISEVIRLSELAAHVAVCPAYLCRIFKRRTGQTVSQCIAQERIERAKELLERSWDRATDIAFAAGFQSVRQFNHVFKARTGLAPSEYRRTARPNSKS